MGTQSEYSTILILMGVYTILLLVLSLSKQLNRKETASCMAVALLFFLLSNISLSNRLSNINDVSLTTNTREYVIQVIEKKYLDTDRTILVRDIETGRIFVLIPPRSIKVKGLAYSGIYKIKAKASFPEPPRNPGSFDYPKYMLHKGLSGTLKARSAHHIETTFGNPFKRFAFYLKQKILNLHNSTLPYPYSHLFTGLIFGEDGTQLPEEMKARYKLTGLSHLLVVSGSQVSLLSGIVFHIISWLGFRRWKGLTAITLVNVVFYFVTGGGASILRAILMNIVMVFSKLFFYKLNPLSAISFSGLLMVCINPFVIYDVGAQLSFLATFSLVYGVDYVEPLLSKRLHRVLRTALALSLAPFIFTTPLLWFHFHTISFVSILSNLLVVNMIECLVVIGFFSTLIGLVIPPLGYILNQACLGVIWILEWSTQWLSQLPLAELVVPLHGGLFMAVYLYLGLLGYCLQHNKQVLIKRASIFVLVLFLGSFIFWKGQRKPLSITFLDVGQGDCTVIQTPENHIIVIDTGGAQLDLRTKEIKRFIATRTLLPFLNHIGANKIDVLITTHYDLDHYGGLIPVLKYKKIHAYIDNGNLTHTIPELPALIKQSVRTYTSITSTQQLNVGNETTLTFFESLFNTSEASKNNKSLVILLEHQGFKALFTGDLEEEGESLLASKFGPHINADVLKVGHHGSHTSSTLHFLEQVTPRLGVISAGCYNRYGHPHSSVLSRYDQLNIPLFRTDTQGAIIIDVINNTLSVTPFLDSKTN